MAQKEIIPELIQYKCRSDLITSYVDKYLGSQSYCDNQVKLQNTELKKLEN